MRKRKIENEPLLRLSAVTARVRTGGIHRLGSCLRALVTDLETQLLQAALLVTHGNVLLLSSEFRRADVVSVPIALWLIQHLDTASSTCEDEAVRDLALRNRI